MTYKPTKEDVERAVKLWCNLAGLKIPKPSSKREWPIAHYLHAILFEHHSRLAERGVFVAEWQKIETAPKEEKIIMNHPVQIGDLRDRVVLLWATHWMPLPPEPKP